MTDTSLSLNAETRERLDDYRHSPDERGEKHYSWDGVLNGMMDVLPTIESFQEGCIHCGQPPSAPMPEAAYGGVIHWFQDSYTNHVHTMYFCDDDCLAEHREYTRNQVPENPDEVVVGGHEMAQTSFSGAQFILDGETREVFLPIPGAFTGQDHDGDAYDYVGEPVYIRHKDEYVQDGVIEDIMHEDGTTTLLLGSDWTVTAKYHPDPARREEYETRNDAGESAV